MKKFVFVAAALCLSFLTGAQNVICTREANPSNLKKMTMEEAIVGGIYPKNSRYLFLGNTITYRRAGKWEIYHGAGDGKISPRPSFETVQQNKALYLVRRDGSRTAIAIPEMDGICYGDTVSRNEFGIAHGVFVSPDSTKIAFYRNDESRVTKFPLLDITTRTGSLREIRYPMAGMDSQRITLGVYDIASGSTVYMNVTEFTEERYLTTVTWSPDSKSIFIEVLSRDQKHLRLNRYDAATGECMGTILTEDNERYVEPRDEHIWFLKGSNDRFIYRTDNRDGWRNLYLCNTDGTVARLTAVDADVQYVANDGRYVYYTSAEVSPVENHLFRLDLGTKSLKNPLDKLAAKAKKQRLTTAEGWHDISMSDDCSGYTDHWSSFTDPGATEYRSTDGKTTIRLETAGDPSVNFSFTKMEFGTVKSADGLYDNYYRLYYPADFDPAKKYPVILYVYGGPHSQMVQNSWLGGIRNWEMLMAQSGYIVYVQDNRGTDNRGAEYEKAIHRHCGQCEMEDQMVGIRMLMDRPYVDSERIGVHGWSYGGFMTISLITNYPDIFKVAVAGGPVIDWQWYEVMYGERYMDTPQTNPDGFAQTSLIGKAASLKGKLLICQGAVDHTVVWEHSLSFVRECIKNNVQVDYFPYPCAEHNVTGRDRIHLMDKVTMYFEDYL